MSLWSLIRLARKIPGPKPVNRYFNPALAHHTPAGFRNNHPHPRPIDGETSDPSSRPATVGRVDLDPVQADLGLLHAGAGNTVTWIGHSTVLVQIGGRTIITDPIFSRRASPVPFAGPKRVQPPGIALADLPRVDLVVLSHNHYDHLDLRSVRALARQRGGPPAFAVPLGLERWMRRNVWRADRKRIFALDWWQSANIDGMPDGLRATLVPVHHWSARTLWNRNENLWGGWAVEADGFRFFFSGDTAYSRDMPEVGARLGPFDLAAIAIGHYEPRWFMHNHHVNPEEAVRIHKELRARRSLGIHWGTFARLTMEPIEQPLHDLAAARERHGVAEDDFFTLRHGETRVIS